MESLFGSDALELAISLALFFLTVSLICSAMREMIEALMKTRSADLERALRELLGDADGAGIMADVMRHPLIAGLYKGEYRRVAASSGKAAELRNRNFPSYIPAGQFAAAIVDLAARGPGSTAPYAMPSNWQGPVDLDSLRSFAPSIPHAALRRAVQTATDGASTLDEAKRRLEAWFNGSMDRASGWYKRRTQWILLAIGFVAAIGLNLDSITVVRRLYEDPALRAAALRQAGPTSNPVSSPPRTPSIEELRTELASVGFPIGWSWHGHTPWPLAQERPCAPTECRAGIVAAGYGGRMISIGTLLLMPLGWLITALAVTLGAPFWFDLLGKFMIVRSTIKPAQKSPEAQSPETEAPRPLAAAEDPDVTTGRNITEATMQTRVMPASVPPLIINRWRTGLDPDEGLA